MSSINPVFLFPEPPEDGSYLKIDAAFIAEHSLVADRAFYVEKAKAVVSLNIVGISEDGVERVFAMFPSLRHLRMQGITIEAKALNAGQPMQLETLQLIKCKVHENVLGRWLKTLQNIRLDGGECLPHGGPIAHHLNGLSKVRRVYIEDRDRASSVSIPESAEYFYFDGRIRNYLPKANDALKTLVLGVCPEDMEILQDCRKLQHLRIIMSVNANTKMELESLRLDVLDVHCSLPSTQPNLIFMLDNDCLDMIFSYLDLEECIPLMLAHSRFSDVICQLRLPKEEIEIYEGTLSAYSESEIKWILRTIGAHAQAIFFTEDIREHNGLKYFKKLEALYTHEDTLRGKERQIIPAGLKKFSIRGTDKWSPRDCMETDSEDSFEDNYFSNDEEDEWDSWESGDEMPVKYSVKELFQKLNPTLTSLHLSYNFEQDDLDVLENLHELKWTEYKHSPICGLLGKNASHLKVLEIEFFNSCRKSPKWYAHWDDFDDVYRPPRELVLCAMPELRVLRLKKINRNVDIRWDLLPCLEDISISFDYELSESDVANIRRGISSLTQLQSVVCEGKPTDINWLLPLKNLRKLDYGLNEQQLMDVLRQLPKLTSVTVSAPCFSSEFEKRLKDFLITDKRSIYIRFNYNWNRIAFP